MMLSTCVANATVDYRVPSLIFAGFPGVEREKLGTRWGACAVLCPLLSLALTPHSHILFLFFFISSYFIDPLACVQDKTILRNRSSLELFTHLQGRAILRVQSPPTAGEP
jgi:hypothetical protein